LAGGLFPPAAEQDFDLDRDRATGIPALQIPPDFLADGAAQFGGEGGIGREMSAAATWPDGPTVVAVASAAAPVPVAMSSTLWPSARRAARRRPGTKSREIRPKP
jgi:hypothetical protein